MVALTAPIYISGAGAVTPGGFTARQTCAAIRASLSGFVFYKMLNATRDTRVVARVPSDSQRRWNEGEWLVGLGARAIGDAMEGVGVDSRSTVILLTPPESFRQHPAFETISPDNFLAAVIRETGHDFHPLSRSVDGGSAAGIGLLERVDELLQQSDVEQVLLGGVDSLVNDLDMFRLAKAGRLSGDDNAQGLVPGEGAAFVRLTRAPEGSDPVSAVIHGFGVAQEEDSVLTEKYSQGRAQLAAMKDAVAGPGPKESDIDFLVSTANGERYLAWEQMIARSRFFRAGSGQVTTVYPAMTVGEVGSASGALALLLMADSFRGGYAPGKVAMCEVSSENGLRAAVVVAEARHR